MSSSFQLFNKDTQCFIYNMQLKAVQRMLDFDYAADRKSPSVAAIINPTGTDSYQKFFFGTQEVLLPVYQSMQKAAEKHPNVDVFINYASFRSAASSSSQALDLPQIKTVVIIAEGVPEKDARQLIKKSKTLGKMIIGPATVGGIKAGAFKIGNTGGTIENIMDSGLHRPGSVGFVSKSGGMSNESYNIIARNTDGLYEGVAIGGDRYPGSTLLEHLLRYEQNPEIKMLVCLGEVGGTDEYEIVEALKNKQITKPLVIWVTGTCAKAFKTDVQFGHAGAKADSNQETADAKNAALKAAGAVVPQSFDDFGERIAETFNKLKSNGSKPAADVPQKSIPMDWQDAVKSGLVRKPTSFVTTISDERGEELQYGDLSISDVFKQDIGLGGVLSLLWFKKLLSPKAARFIEIALMIVADHGPAVSGAHNTIVATRAGKDLISSLASGLLTIGPRFGGAIDGAAQMFSAAYDEGLAPADFVKQMKSKNINIQGIGHRVKSIHNPDMRVTIVKEYAQENFDTPVLDYALAVEQVTTQKRDNLILNVDGCIGVSFVDVLRCELPREEADEAVAMGALNGLFVIGRSIGLVGHHLDQKRLKQGLYRHPWDDIAYMTSSD